MALYFLNYDLRNSRDYQKLYDELEKFDAVRILESLWCFKRANTSSSKLRGYFKQFIDSDDGLCISEVTDWSTFNALKTPNDLS
ncbi:MAG: hypothetical protein DRI23_05655 [Candidatus Cloacimonadota bacterium]|nr:MAG: hypothetical protein DRH79_07905 [Candidatus Cloacimonadota bacterium]RLC51141.1 MAG: hypothetical protein DRI23_05655 [Candidatus Cloacimonadota bacterium]